MAAKRDEQPRDAAVSNADYVSTLTASVTLNLYYTVPPWAAGSDAVFGGWQQPARRKVAPCCKGGANVKEVPAPPAMTGDLTEAMKRFREENPGKPFPGMASGTGDRCTATAMKISAAIAQIQYSSRSDRTVIDDTGLKGYYDFSFRMPRHDDGDAMGEIEEDLGMKFEPRKMELTTYVIDSAEKPSEN